MPSSLARIPEESMASFSTSTSTSTFASSSSSSVAIYPNSSTSFKKSTQRPTLTANDFLQHAFGTSSETKHDPLGILTLNTNPLTRVSTCSSSETSPPRQLPCAISPDSLVVASSSKPALSDTSPESFRSFRSSKSKCSRQILSLTELNPFCTHSQHQSRSRPNDKVKASVSCLTLGPDREQPMSAAEWRDNAKHRMAWRQKRKFALSTSSSAHEQIHLPFDIDCNLIEGSLGLPPVGHGHSFSRASDGGTRLLKSASSSQPQSPQSGKGKALYMDDTLSGRKDNDTKPTDALAAHCAAFVVSRVQD